MISKSPIEDVIIRFEPLRRPEVAAGIQGKELKVARFGDRAIGRTAQLDANLDWLVDLRADGIFSLNVKIYSFAY